MIKRQIQIASVFLVLMGCQANFSSSESKDITDTQPTIEFRYDETTGKCVNAEGIEGLNVVDHSRIREPDFIGECADLRNTSISGIFDHRDFRGADFTGTKFTFATGTGMNLMGAKIEWGTGGYNFFSRIIYDQFTDIKWACTTVVEGTLDCRRP
jgi:uncharacterized protein YjbI with pentapeptide repeats